MNLLNKELTLNNHYNVLLIGFPWFFQSRNEFAAAIKDHKFPSPTENVVKLMKN